MSIYTEIIDALNRNEKIYIKLETQTLYINGKPYIKNGFNLTNFDIFEGNLPSREEAISKTEELYFAYKYSVPSEQWSKKNRMYFKALTIAEIPDDKIFNGIPRYFAETALNGYVLCLILENIKIVDENKWFWQSDKDKDLIVLKKWFKEN